MQKLTKLISILFFILLSGCAITGGTKGKIENNTYTAKNRLFTISIPHKEGSYENKYMKIKEEYRKNDTYVSFGPAAFNYSIYRSNIIVHPESGKKTIPLDTAAPQILESTKKQMVKHYGTSPKILETKKTKINNRNAYYWKLTQNIPAGKGYSNKNKVFNHHVYVVDYKIAAGIFWVRIPSDTGSREAGITPKQFVESLKLMPNKSFKPTP